MSLRKTKIFLVEFFANVKPIQTFACQNIMTAHPVVRGRTCGQKRHTSSPWTAALMRPLVTRSKLESSDVIHLATQLPGRLPTLYCLVGKEALKIFGDQNQPFPDNMPPANCDPHYRRILGKRQLQTVATYVPCRSSAAPTRTWKAVLRIRREPIEECSLSSKSCICQCVLPRRSSQRSHWINPNLRPQLPCVPSHEHFLMTSASGLQRRPCDHFGPFFRNKVRPRKATSMHLKFQQLDVTSRLPPMRPCCLCRN